MGAGETLRVDVDPLPSSGTLGIMVRARGVGTLTTLLRGPAGAVVIPAVAVSGPGSSFADLAATTSAGATYSWSDDRGRPVALELVSSVNAEIEIDCVVPFLVP